jgi:hypothetical protein
MGSNGIFSRLVNGTGLNESAGNRSDGCREKLSMPAVWLTAWDPVEWKDEPAWEWRWMSLFRGPRGTGFAQGCRDADLVNQRSTCPLTGGDQDRMSRFHADQSLPEWKRSPLPPWDPFCPGAFFIASRSSLVRRGELALLEHEDRQRQRDDDMNGQ